MVDRTIAGEGDATGLLKVSDDWDTCACPASPPAITGTLKGVGQGGKHTDRVKVTGTPLVECPCRPVRRPAAHRRQPDRRREVRRRCEGRRRRVRHDRPQAGQGRRQDPMRGHHRGLEHRRLERLPRGSPRPAWPSAASCCPSSRRRCRRDPLGRTSQDLDRQARRACRQMIR